MKVNGEVKPIIYSANIKRKGEKIHTKNGYVIANIYVQDMYGNHKWIW